LDPRIFVPGPTRRRFETTMTGLAACGVTLAAKVPQPPTERMRSVRSTFVHACTQLELVPELLRDDVLRARSPARVRGQTVGGAAGRAGGGVRSVVGGLATMRRLLATPS